MTLNLCLFHRTVDTQGKHFKCRVFMGSSITSTHLIIWCHSRRSLYFHLTAIVLHKVLLLSIFSVDAEEQTN